VILSSLDLFSAQILLVLLEVSLDLSELVEELVVLEDLQVLHVVVGLSGTFEFFLGLSGIHTLQDAEASEVLERQLQLADGLGTGQVLRLLSLLALLDFLRHYVMRLLFL